MSKRLITAQQEVGIKAWMAANYVFSITTHLPSPINTALAASEHFYEDSQCTETLYAHLQRMAEEVRDNPQFAELVERQRELRAIKERLTVVALCPLDGQSLEFDRNQDLLALDNSFAVRSLRYHCPQGHIVFVADHPPFILDSEVQGILQELEDRESAIIAALAATEEE